MSHVNMESAKENRLMDKQSILRAIDKIAFEIAEDFPGKSLRETAIIGIQLKGVYLAEKLRERLREVTGHSPLYGTLDISMYRDDIGVRKTLPRIHETSIPFDVNDRNIILVDDVLWKGRTIRAALDAITDYGRPKTIKLAVLILRKGMEFPIHAEYVGAKCSVDDDKKVCVNFQEYDGEDSVNIQLFEN